MIQKISDSLSINLPWEPDMLHAYKFGLCELCEKEKLTDEKFDNSTCPHCRKLTKMISWAKGMGVSK